MHHIYHTEGIILGSEDKGEASKRYDIFTRELGLVHARATGVRKLSSRLRFILQDFACVKVDLVQGRNFWRVTSASKTSALEFLAKDRAKLAIVFEIANLLKRLLPASEPNEKLFTDILCGFTILEKSGAEEDLRNLEVIIVLRALHSLGYIGGGETLNHLIQSPLEADLVYQIGSARSLALREINQALRASHL